MNHEEQLQVISKAWGRQSGYAFFPWIEGSATNRAERINGYHEGRAYLWPKDKEAILEHFAAHTNDDLYWCPSLFEAKSRRLELAMDEHALWADLDEVDPRGIDEEFKPTIAWESSPGRYQALWIVANGDIQGASWPGGENQRLTYYLGADAGGWDTTQLLRIPGWKNHKPHYKDENGGQPYQGKLLWKNGRRFLPDEFNDLPEVASAAVTQNIVEDEIDRIDRHEVWGRVRLSVSSRVRELMAAREPSGDRSDALWEIERELADAGCTIPEIVSVVRGTVWNKFSGRADELRRLVTEASKAYDQRSDETVQKIEKELEHKPAPTRLLELLANVKPPKWLVENIWAEGSCGFIAGQPKSYKSWTGFDLALSVATGVDFLNYFKVLTPGPVLMIQEEDPAPILKTRFEKIWPGKLSDRVVREGNDIVWIPRQEVPKDPDVMAYVGEGFTVSEPGWQAWLDTTLSDGLNGQPYRMVLMDPLMMIAGAVEDNRAQEMTERVFKPLKQLSRKHDVAIAIVHHMRKGDPKSDARGGQRMLGSVANHAWTENALYLTLAGPNVKVETESKHSPAGSFVMTRVRNKEWVPEVTKVDLGLDDPGDPPSHAPEVKAKPPRAPASRGKGQALEALREAGGGPLTSRALAELADMSLSGASKQLNRAQSSGYVKKTSRGWVLDKAQ